MKRSKFKCLILSEAAKRGWKARDIARRLKLTDGAVSQFLNGQNNSINMAVRICQKLDLDTKYAFQTCGLALPDACQTRKARNA